MDKFRPVFIAWLLFSQPLSAEGFDPDAPLGDKCQQVFCHPDSSAPDTYYVNQATGSDANSGVRSDPFASIMAGVDRAVPGDTICVAEGLYQEDVEITGSGTAEKPIMLDVLAGSEGNVVVEGESIKIHGASHITVRGFKVQNAHNGFRVRGPEDPYAPPAENIRLIDNVTYNTFSSGVSIWGSKYQEDSGNYNSLNGVLVENTRIELANNGGWDEQITVAKGVRNAHIRYNEITNSAVESHGGEGIDFKDGVRDSYIYGNYIHDVTRRAIYVDGGVAPGALTSNIHIFGNYLENIDNSTIYVMTEGVGNVDGVYIYNNVVNGASNSGIGVYDHPAGAEQRALCEAASLPPCGQIRNIEIVNNTVVDANRELWWGNIHIDHPDVTGVIRNNLSIGGDGQPIEIKGGTTGMLIENNLCDIDDRRCAIVADPLVTEEFRPLPGSPLIDAGAATGAPEVDFDGGIRPQGAAHDIGAFEYVP
jgi:hypothetical protein